VTEPERTLVEPTPDAAARSPARRPSLGGPERLALAIYGACLTLVLVLYHFQ